MKKDYLKSDATEKEKNIAISPIFDFYKKNQNEETLIDVEKPKKNKKKLNIDKKKGFLSIFSQKPWVSSFIPVVTASAALMGLYFNVESSGWIIFLSILLAMTPQVSVIKRLGVMTLGLLGLGSIALGIPYAGWVIFLAFMALNN